MSEDTGNVVPIRPGKLVKGSPEAKAHMQALVERRRTLKAEREARGEAPPPRGSRRRMRPLTEEEIRAHALKTAAELFDGARLAAVQLLERQMHHKDPGIAQRAAVKVLEYTDGKPTQTIVQHNEGAPTEVVYITSALQDVPVAGADAPFVPAAVEDTA